MSLDTGVERPAPATPAGDRHMLGARAGRGTRVVGFQDLLTPVLCAVILVVLYLNVHGRDLDSIERNILTPGDLVGATIQHVYVSVVIALLVMAIAVPLGVLVTRRRTRRLAPIVLGLGNVGQSAPSIGLLALFGTYFFIGFWAVVIILTAYTALSVLRNTIVGLGASTRTCSTRPAGWECRSRRSCSRWRCRWPCR